MKIIRWLPGLLVVSLIVASGAFFVAGSDTPTYTITADVTQAPNLFEGGRVMVRGVEVGKIAKVEPHGEAVTLTLTIDADVELPADARLSVVPITVIADRYVQLYPPYDDGPTMRDGDHIDVADTSIPAELDEVLGQLKGLLTALEPAPGEASGPLAKLVASLEGALDGHADELSGALAGSADVLENLADSDADLVALVRNLDRLFVALADRSSEIGLVNERFALIAESLARDQIDIEGTIENVAFLSEEAAGLVSESGEALGRSFGRLERVLNTVLSHQDELREGIRWTNVIAQSLGATDSSGRGLYAYSGRQAAPGTPGATYNYRIDSRDTIACERIGVLVQSLLVVNPTASTEALTNTALTFFPDEYDEHIRYLIELLLPICADYPSESDVAAEAAETVRRLARSIGRERMQLLLAKWFADGLRGEGR